MNYTKKDFNPNLASDPDAGIYGLPFGEKESKLVFLPVPWEATTSYGGGTVDGPSAILTASAQLDLFDLELTNPYEPGMFMREESKTVRKWNTDAKKLSKKIIDVGGNIGKSKPLKEALAKVNDYSEKVNAYVYEQSAEIMKNSKILALVGGDHACPLGAFKAAGEKYGDFGILHFDAHSDTRDAYEGFKYSHASIMRNALDEVPQIKKLTQVGIRDFCQEEFDYVAKQGARASVFYDATLQRRKFQGENWSEISKEIVATLPKQVWISFDIDGLDPRFCPHTGTPVPGGQEFAEAIYLIREVAISGRKIIGFDLCEVSPGAKQDDSEWDANVGMRLLYKLAIWTLYSQGLVKLRK